uniref:Uncharacterized protein n=1 Tax=Trypanosoma vivax (strain Y486) TaxID=1055687 RepID=G0TZK2_TRYVY|nr:hypothetical protein, unlikely [Trypanosoma vivax Y486]
MHTHGPKRNPGTTTISLIQQLSQSLQSTFFFDELTCKLSTALVTATAMWGTVRALRPLPHCAQMPMCMYLCLRGDATQAKGKRHWPHVVTYSGSENIQALACVPGHKKSRRSSEFCLRFAATSTGGTRKSRSDSHLQKTSLLPFCTANFPSLPTPQLPLLSLYRSSHKKWP